MASFQVVNSVTSVPRPVANFPKSALSDSFSSLTKDYEKWEKCSRENARLKDEVRTMLVTAGAKSWIEKLDFINTIERLGVSYHFKEYIEEQLEMMFKTHANLQNEDYDLFTTAIYFRILRQHGYDVSSEVFHKFKVDGKFGKAITSDPKGLLSLYEAAHLRKHGENILDEALAFTTLHLKSMANKTTLVSEFHYKQVTQALQQPLHKGIPRLEAKQYISVYEEDPSMNAMLLKFAKLDFNLLQMLYKQEVVHVMRWWNDKDVASKVTSFRSRVFEICFWAVSTIFEPQYSLARIMFSKMVLNLSVTDDVYDAYGLNEELKLYTNAMQRLDAEDMETLPDYMKVYYTILIDTYREFDDDILKQGRYHDVSYLKEAFKEGAINHQIEAEWRDQKYVPTFTEYYPNAASSTGLGMLAITLYLGMGDAGALEACQWISTKPKCVLAYTTLGRVINDIVCYEEEHEREHVATSVDCYMKEYGVSKEEAVVKLYELIEDTWRDMTEEMVNKSKPVSMHLMNICLNMSRMCHVTYRVGDGYTHSELIMPEITAMLIDPIPV